MLKHYKGSNAGILSIMSPNHPRNGKGSPLSLSLLHLFVQVAESNGLLQNMSLTCDRYTNLQKQTAG
jgi:hypothetical protein